MSLRTTGVTACMCKAQSRDNTQISLKQIAVPLSTTNCFLTIDTQVAYLIFFLPYFHGLIKNREEQNVIYYLLGTATSEIRGHEELLRIPRLLRQSKLRID